MKTRTREKRLKKGLEFFARELITTLPTKKDKKRWVSKCARAGRKKMRDIKRNRHKKEED